jgi:hypothetical protein
MKSLTDFLAISLLACAVAVAQGAPAGSPKPDQTRQTPPDRDSSQGIPGQGTSSTNQDTGTNQAGSTASDSSATEASHTSADNENKGGKKLKGCLRSANGQYMLETKHDKMVSLTGSEDFGPHVGHTVTLHGRFVEGQKRTRALLSGKLRSLITSISRRTTRDSPRVSPCKLRFALAAIFMSGDI